MRRPQIKLPVGGFGFDEVDGKKVPNEAEQVLLSQMRIMKGSGSSLRAIHKWLNDEHDVKLAYSSMREALIRLESQVWSYRRISMC